MNSTYKDNSFFKSFFTDNYSIMLIIDPNSGNILEANKSACKFYQYSHNEITSMNIDKINMLSQERIKHELNNLVNGIQNYFKFEHKLANGEIKNVEVHINKINFDNKTVLIATVYDLSFIKQKEVEVIKSNFKLQKAEEIAQIGHWEYNLNTELVTYSNSAKKIYGLPLYTPKLAKENVKKIPLPFYTQMIEKAFINLIQFNKPYNIEFKIKKYNDGRIRDIHSIAQYNKDANAVFGIIRDITEDNIKNKRINRLSQTVIQSANAVIITDINGSVIYTNPAFSEITGYSAEEIIGKNPRFLKSGETTNSEYQKLWNTITDGKIWKGEFHNKRKDGSLYWEIATISPIFEDEKIKYFLGVKEDISQRKNIEIKLKEQNKEYATLNEEYKTTNEELIAAKQLAEQQAKDIKHITDNASSIIWKAEIDNKGNFINTFISDVVDDFLGLPKGTINNDWDKYFSYIDEKYYSDIFLIFEQGYANLKKRFSFDYEITKANGSTAYFSSRGQALKIDNKLFAFGSTVDITKRKLAEDALAENEAKYRLIFDNSPLGIIYYDTNGVILSCNNEFVRIIGSSKEKLIGLNMLNLPDKQLVESIKKSLSGKISKYKGVYKPVTSDKTIPSNGIFSPIINNGKVTNCIGIIQDITEQKKYEQELKIAKNKAEENEQKLFQKNKEYETINEELRKTNLIAIKAKQKAEESDYLKTSFLQNMSHEIRTPMNGIIGFADLLNDVNITPEQRKNYTNIIKNSGYQLLRIINDILEISKLGTKQVKVFEEKVNLNNLLLEQFAIFDLKAKENNTNLFIKTGLPDDKSIILTDKTKLNKILSNLLENALKFTQEGIIELGYSLVDNEIQIYVKDNGIGIPKDKQKIIFERFSQADDEITKKVGGLGLGLSIAKENAELINGKISLVSEINKGSTFTVTIPYKPATSTIQTNSTEPVYNILIAEDEEINHLFLVAILKKFDNKLQMLHAKNGQEAVEIAQNNDINLILMDLKMPVMNGFDAASKIKKIKPNLPIIAQSAYITEKDKKKALDSGCNDYITKPIDKNILFDLLNKHLKRS